MSEKPKLPMIKNLIKYATTYSFELEVAEIFVGLCFFVLTYDYVKENPKINPIIQTQINKFITLNKENIPFLVNLWQDLSQKK